jgi:hypothetical protein
MKIVPFYILATILLSSTAYANVACDANGCIVSNPAPTAPSAPAPSYVPPPGYTLQPIPVTPATPPPGYVLTPISPPPAASLEEVFAPSWMKMVCYPNDSSPYVVRYYGESGRVDITGTVFGSITRHYPIFDRHDNTDARVLYVAAKRSDQARTLYFAFDYSPDRDVSDIRVKGLNAHGIYQDLTDKCSLQVE